VRIKQNLVKNSKETHYGIHPRERKDKGNRYNMIGVRKIKVRSAQLERMVNIVS